VSGDARVAMNDSSDPGKASPSGSASGIKETRASRNRLRSGKSRGADLHRHQHHLVRFVETEAHWGVTMLSYKEYDNALAVEIVIKGLVSTQEFDDTAKHLLFPKRCPQSTNSPSAPPVHEPENKQKQQGADRRRDNGSDNAGAEVNAQLR